MSLMDEGFAALPDRIALPLLIFSGALTPF
jgi:hypothetical protein